MEWIKNLSKAIDYIESNLAGDISYDEAARIACCSTYYFQRMFSYVAGISLSSYIRRRRMTKAAFELQTSDKRVMDIGAKYGYDSPTSFNRAFQSVHSVAPTAARVEGTLLNSYPPIRFSINVIGGESMSYRVEKRKSVRIVGLRVPLKEDSEHNFKIVPKFWDETLRSDVFHEICELCDQDPNGILGVTAYNSPTEIYYYIGASTDKEVPDNMFELEIPEATWVIFESNGPLPDTVQKVYKRFLTEWLPFSSYEYAKLPDIEVYPISEKARVDRSQVWIAVKKIKEE